MWLLILRQWEMVVRNLIILYAVQVWNRIYQPPSWRIMVPKVKDITLKFILDTRKRNGFWRWRNWWSVSSLICMIFFSISNLMFNFHEGKAKELRDVRNVTLITSSNHTITLKLVMVPILTWYEMVFRQLRTYVVYHMQATKNACDIVWFWGNDRRMCLIFDEGFFLLIFFRLVVVLATLSFQSWKQTSKFLVSG